MNPFVAIGSVLLALLAGSTVVSATRALAALFARGTGIEAVVAGLGVSLAGSWWVWSRGAPEALMVLGAASVAGAVLGGLARRWVGRAAGFLSATAVLAVPAGGGAWLLWYGSLGQPWARGVAVGLAGGGILLGWALGWVLLAQVVSLRRWCLESLPGSRGRSSSDGISRGA